MGDERIRHRRGIGDAGWGRDGRESGEKRRGNDGRVRWMSVSVEGGWRKDSGVNGERERG